MNNIELLLKYQFYIYSIAAFIGLIMVCSFKNRRAVTSLLFLNWMSVVGLSSLIYLFLFSDTLICSEVTLFVISIELVLLYLVTYLLRDMIFKIKLNIDDFTSNRVLTELFLISAGISLYLFISNPSTFGIMSEGSRIEYLASGGLVLILTYLNIVIQYALTIVIGTRLYVSKSTWLDVVALLFTFVASLLAGSKGYVFMTILYIGVLAWGLGYTLKRGSLVIKILTIIVLLTSVCVYLFFLSTFLNFTFEQTINLVFTRFILSADARALATDSSIHQALMSNMHGNLLAEIFKGYSIKLGNTVSTLPLGVAQYAAAYGIDSFTGANAGLSSIILTYYDGFTDILFIVLTMIFTMVIIGAGYVILVLSIYPFQKLISISFLFTLLLTFVQDYHAFIQIAHLLFIWMVIIFFWRLTIASVSHMPSTTFNQ